MGLSTKYTFTKTELPDSFTNGSLKQIPLPILKILYKRGYTTEENITDMLYGNLEKSLSLTTMQDTEKALPILKAAVKKKQKIVIYQDYDVDGCSAGALCLETLRAIGADVVSYVNAREKDGYGICKNGIDQIQTLYPDAALIMTVDNGIVAHEAVAYAKTKGYTVIVTDHHLPGETLPEADAVIDPKRKDEFYPFHELCGTGVVFKLMLALYDYMGKDAAPVMSTVDIVGLATVADVVPLIGENRDLVREALRMMNDGTRPAFRIMKELTQAKEINSQYTIGFQFAPMINALSRMGEDSYLATETLISTDEDIIRKNVALMIEVNKARKEATNTQLEIAEELLRQEIGDTDTKTMTKKERIKALPSAIILKHELFTEGVVGIVAGRLKNEYHRPVVIFAPSGDGVLKASCRSIDEFPLKERLDSIAELLLGYGGHTKAAGLSVAEDKFEDFKKAFLAMSDEMEPEAFIEKIELDDVFASNEISVRLIQDLRMLEPYGEAWAAPLFGLVFHADAVRFMGEDDKHVKYWDRENNLSVIEWNGGEAEKRRQARNETRSKVVGTMSLNEFNGEVSAQFMVQN